MGTDVVRRHNENTTNGKQGPWVLMLHKKNDFIADCNGVDSTKKSNKELAITCINSLTSKSSGGGASDTEKRVAEALDNISVSVKSEAFSADSTYDEDLLQSKKKHCPDTSAQGFQEKYMSDFAEHFEKNAKNGVDLANSSEQLQSLLNMNFTVSDYISQQYLVRGSASYKVLKDKIREYCLSLKPSGMKDDTSTQVLFLVYKSLPDMMRTDEADSCIRKMIGKHIRNAKYRAKCKQKEYKLCENDRLYSMSGPRTSSMSASEVSPPSMIPTSIMPKLHSASKPDSTLLDDHLIHPQASRPNFSSTSLQISDFKELLASSMSHLPSNIERSPDNLSPTESTHTPMSSIYKPVQLLYQSPRQSLFSQGSRPHSATEATSPLDVFNTLNTLKMSAEQPNFLPLSTLKSVSENLANSLNYSSSSSFSINKSLNTTNVNLGSLSSHTSLPNTSATAEKPAVDEGPVMNDVCDHKLKFINSTTYACVHCNDYFERLPRQNLMCQICKKQFSHQHLLMQHTHEVHLNRSALP